MRKNRIADVFLSGTVLGLVFLAAATFSQRKNAASEPNAILTYDNSSQDSSKPLVIWWGSLYRDPEILRLALSSGIFSHAVLVERNDLQRQNYLSNPNFRKAFRICRENNVKVIWTRWLYPSQRVREMKPDDVFSTFYYAERIRKIKEEGREMGADFVAFDVEPYANSPAMPFRSRSLSASEYRRLEDAVEKAIKETGQVDFVVPVGCKYDNHLYEGVRKLGNVKMGTQTYYDIKQDPNTLKAYDVFGAAVSVKKENTNRPGLTLFTPREILSRQDLWSHKKGLFIYPYGKGDADLKLIAREFSKIKIIHPVPDSNEVR